MSLDVGTPVAAGSMAFLLAEQNTAGVRDLAGSVDHT
jgi:hypothetical protein